MKKITDIQENRPQTDRATNQHLPVKNAMTDPIKNTANQIEGLNQSRIVADELFPSDGDNMTQ
jgi:hypothetical protein